MRLKETCQGVTPLDLEGAVEIALSPDDTITVTFLREGDGLRYYRLYRRDRGAHYTITPEDTDEGA